MVIKPLEKIKATLNGLFVPKYDKILSAAGLSYLSEENKRRKIDFKSDIFPRIKQRHKCILKYSDWKASSIKVVIKVDFTKESRAHRAPSLQ
ncbi:MAG: hypothetical protein ACI9DK_002381 [Vicingaceae bacterium]